MRSLLVGIGVVVVAAVVAVVAGASLARTAMTLPGLGPGSNEQHVLPSPSWWTTTPYPLGSPRPPSRPSATSTAPTCPAWAPHLVYVQRGGYYECLADVPPDPHRGPGLASPVPSPTAR